MTKTLSLIVVSALVTLTSLAVWAPTADAATDSRETVAAPPLAAQSLDGLGPVALESPSIRFGPSQTTATQPQQASPLPKVDPRLYSAVWRGQLERVQALIAEGVEVNAVDEDGDPVLYEAVWRRYTDIARELINAGADVDALDKDDDPLLRAAVWRDYLDVVQLMIAAGANVSAVDSDDNPLLYAAIWRGYTETVRALVDAGADVDALDQDDDPMLREAIWRNQVEIVRILVAAGADIDVLDADDHPVLRAAIWRGYTEIVQILVDAGVNVNVEDADGDSMLHEARWRGHTEIVDILVAAGATDPITPTAGGPEGSSSDPAQAAADACQVGMTLNEGDSCTVASAEVLLGTDQFSIQGGRGCFGTICVSGSVRVNEFAATQSGSTWTVVTAPGAEQSADGPTGTTGAGTPEPVVEGGMMTEVLVEARIVARLLADGRIQLGFRPVGASLIVSRSRFPAASVGRWLTSSAVVQDGQTLGRITARRLENGNVEFGFIPSGGERLLPSARMFPADATVGRWLQTSVFGFVPE